MAKFYRPITTISNMVGTITGSIVNIFEKTFPDNFFNHIYIDTRLANIEQRDKKKKIIGFRPPAIAFRPNFLLEETLIDSTDIMPFSIPLIQDDTDNILIEAIMERVKFSIAIKMKIESKLKTWDVVAWLKRYFIYKSPVVISNVYLDSLLPSNLVKDLLIRKELSLTISDLDTILMYLNENSIRDYEFFRKINNTTKKTSIVFRHPENLLYSINDFPQTDFSKRGFSDSENYIDMELNIETWFPVGYKTNFLYSPNNSEETVRDTVGTEIEIGEGYDYVDDYDQTLTEEDYENPTIDEDDPFYPPDDLYLPSDDIFAEDTNEFSNLDELFNHLPDEIVNKIKLYLKNYNASKDYFYNYDTITGRTSNYIKLENQYEEFIRLNNKAKVGLHRTELPSPITILLMNSISFTRGIYCPNQDNRNILGGALTIPLNTLTEEDVFNSPSDDNNSFELTYCNLTEAELASINNEIFPNPIDEEIYDSEDNQKEFFLNPNNVLLDYYLDDDEKEITLTFFGPISLAEYDNSGKKKILSSYFVSDVNTPEDELDLYNEFNEYYRNLISFILNKNININDVFKVYVYGRNGALIQPNRFTFNWETLKLVLDHPYYNMTYNIGIYGNMVKLKEYSGIMEQEA